MSGVREIDGVTVGPAIRVGGVQTGGPVTIPGGGTAGAPASYTHHQDEPSTTWVIEHGLGRRPIAWSLYDVAGRECTGYVVDHPETNRALVRMDVPTAGTLYLI